MIERRRRITPELLTEVARQHAIVNPPKYGHLARIFDVSPRTAQRYITLARRRGFLQ